MPSEPAARCAADRHGLDLAAEWLDVLDVDLDGVRVLSVDPRRYRVQPGGVRRVPWPVQLVPYLKGSTELRVRVHGAEESLVRLAVTFDDYPGRVRVVDADGHPLAADKLGRLSRTFETQGSGFVGQLLDEVEALIADLNEILRVPTFLAYGGLLGAVREGNFIGHDNDVDISYLSSRTHPADIALEAFDLRRGLRQRGWGFHASTATFLQVLRDGAPAERRIDIFTSYFVSEVFAMDCWVRGQLRRADILPLGEIVLAGRSLPAPAVPERLLELTYGPDWAVPDPAFKFVVPRSTSARAYGWFGRPVARDAIGLPDHLLPPRPDETLRPTEYAEWVLERWPASTPIIDLRQGVGHDPTWWAEQGRTVTAFDVRENSRTFRNDRPHLDDRLILARLPISDYRQVMAAACTTRQSRSTPLISLGPTLPTLRPAGRANLWRLVRFLLFHGGEVALETSVELEPDVVREIVEAGGTDVRRQALGSDRPDSCDSVRLRSRWPERVRSPLLTASSDGRNGGASPPDLGATR